MKELRKNDGDAVEASTVPTRQSIVVSLERLNAKGRAQFAIFVDGKRRYSGMAFDKTETLERIETLRRRVDVVIEPASEKLLKGDPIMKKSTEKTAKKDGAAKKVLSPAEVYPMVREPEIKAAFLQLVDKGKANECWKWQGEKSINSSTGSYSGAFRVKGTSLRVAKVAALIADPNADPAARYTASVCKDPFCANPAHITAAGTVVEKDGGKPKKTATKAKGKVTKKAAAATSVAKSKGKARARAAATA